MGFCAACGQPGDLNAGVCRVCGARTAGAAGAGDRDGGRAPDDTPVVGPFGFYEPFDGLFRDLRTAQPGAPEDPYARLYARRWAERRSQLARRPTAAPGGREVPAWRQGGASWDPAPTRQFEEAGWFSGPLQQPGGAGLDPGPLRQDDGPGLGSDPLQYYGWMRRPSPAIGSRKRIVLAVLAVIALVAGGGGALGYGMYRDRPPPITPAAQGSAAGSRPGSAARASSPPAELGNGTVTVTPAVAGVPAAGPIINLLTSYFRAVNAHDYVAYRRLLDPRMQADMSAALFGAGYRSTEDSQATLTGISAMPNGQATADIVFTSHQKPSDSPDRTACTNWTLKMFLERANGSYVIGESPPGYRPVHQPCQAPRLGPPTAA